MSRPSKLPNADLGDAKTLSFDGFTFPHLHQIFGSSPQLSIWLCLEKKQSQQILLLMSRSERLIYLQR
jgi:hypothetical protein